jgi:hypothetical protein
MIKAFTASILSLFFFYSSVQIAFINENTEGYLEKAGLLKLTREICIKKGTVPGNTGRMGTLPQGHSAAGKIRSIGPLLTGIGYLKGRLGFPP